jgi:hypothetical protein
MNKFNTNWKTTTAPSAPATLPADETPTPAPANDNEPEAAPVATDAAVMAKKFTVIPPNAPKMSFASEEQKVKKYEYDSKDNLVCHGIHLTQDLEVPIATFKQQRSKINANAISVPGVPITSSMMYFSMKDAANEQQIRSLINTVREGFAVHGATVNTHVEFLEAIKLYYRSKNEPKNSYLKIPFEIYRAIINHLLDPTSHPPPENKLIAASLSHSSPTSSVTTVTSTAARKRAASPKERIVEPPKRRQRTVVDNEDSPAASNAATSEDSEESSDDEAMALASHTAKSLDMFASAPMAMAIPPPLWLPPSEPSVHTPITGLTSLFSLTALTARPFSSKMAQVGYATATIAKQLEARGNDEEFRYCLAAELAANLVG